MRRDVLTSHPSSSVSYEDSHPDMNVVVAVLGETGMRDLLGHSELDGTAVAAAHAGYQSPEWIVDVQFTDAGSIKWDTLANKEFHETSTVRPFPFRSQSPPRRRSHPSPAG
jgi:hypothetical protein